MKEKNIFKIINYLHVKTNISKLKILVDIIKCNKKYGFNKIEYADLNLYNIEEEKRKTIISSKINKQLIKKLNKITDVKVFKSRSKFYKKFNRFILEDWVDLTGNNIIDFSKFILKKDNFIALYDNINNKEEFIIPVDKKNYTLTYNDLVLSKKSFVKEITKECKETKTINENSKNYISFIVINNEILYAYLVTAKDNSLKKIYIPINIETGIIDYPGVDDEYNKYEIHPDSGINIIWTTLPRWPRTKRLVIKIAEFIKEIKYFQVDIVLTNKGPSLLNINPYPNYIPTEKINLVSYNKGSKDKIKNLLKEE